MDNSNDEFLFTAEKLKSNRRENPALDSKGPSTWQGWQGSWELEPLRCKNY